MIGEEPRHCWHRASDPEDIKDRQSPPNESIRKPLHCTNRASVPADLHLQTPAIMPIDR
ncbi:hypothetical protein FRACA_2280012 [Frankia canadensis]|uniref:Uncharacterized protein n=1 Tax=Frankia canadensis TaxID=1836972 RepID=A0A2I2KRC4_9ACTN|nr:hypothetical protein FRACA_2280012 [Frankia canadensis]SOU55490.1 hypothetical protein FRACA_2280012 [Frankia canadensis]